jgi:hypothetical protein
MEVGVNGGDSLDGVVARGKSLKLLGGEGLRDLDMLGAGLGRTAREDLALSRDSIAGAAGGSHGALGRDSGKEDRSETHFD